ncbi:hypothetical protein VULLAG_LOCUS7558 [Vulpes lagopus]
MIPTKMLLLLLSMALLALGSAQGIDDEAPQEEDETLQLMMNC